LSAQRAENIAEVAENSMGADLGERALRRSLASLRLFFNCTIKGMSWRVIWMF